MSEDRAFAQRVAAGEPEACRLLVEGHYASVLRFMRCLTRRREDAEDLTQETFVAARGKIRSFRGEASLRTWIHRVAYRTFTHWKRRQRPSAVLNGSEFAPDAGFVQALDAIVLLDALYTLPIPQRSAFVLAEVQQMELREVAQAMGVPIGTVKSRIFHAKRRLRELIGDESTETHHEKQPCEG